MNNSSEGNHSAGASITNTKQLDAESEMKFIYKHRPDLAGCYHFHMIGCTLVQVIIWLMFIAYDGRESQRRMADSLWRLGVSHNDANTTLISIISTVGGYSLAIVIAIVLALFTSIIITPLYKWCTRTRIKRKFYRDVTHNAINQYTKINNNQTSNNTTQANEYTYSVEEC